MQYNKLKRNRNVRAGAKAWEIKENSDEFTVTIKGNTVFSESDTPSFQDESCHESVFLRIRINMRKVLTEQTHIIWHMQHNFVSNSLIIRSR